MSVRRNTLLFVASCFLLAALGLVVALELTASSLTTADVNRLKIGMSRSEAVEALGKPALISQFFAYWNASDGVIAVIFSGDEVGGLSADQLNLYQRLRVRIFGLPNLEASPLALN